MHGLKTLRVAVIGLLCLSAVPALAEDMRTVPQSREEMQLSFAPLVKRTHNAVVNVYAERIIHQRVDPFGGDPFFEQFFGQHFPTRTEKETSLGSGVMVEANGTIVTNNHVIEGADDIKVALSDGREYPVKVLLKDPRLDLAVLKIQSKDDNFQTMPIADSDKAEVGDVVLAIGNPFGVGQTVTSGIVSGLARNQVKDGDVSFFIQTDAAINPGNSGGALMNTKGELIGINTMIYSKGGGSNGIGFAIPSNLVKVFLAAAEHGDKSFERPYLGASFEPVTSDVANALGLKRVLGALVVKTDKDSPAARAGLKAGEVITAVDGMTVEHPDALNYRLTTAGLGKTVTLTVIDNGQEKQVSLRLEGPPETIPRDEKTLAGNNPFDGLTVGNLSPRLAYELQMPTDSTGVVVTRVKDGSISDQLGFQPKDILLSINGNAVRSSEDMVRLARANPNFWRVEIDRDGQKIRQIFR
ncbi:DegQ family serine endoprotease [Allorhizobium sp. BGMRC 0089]|uniref:DegQ family serine endoprotease n=1 Tax=Allorhizobium sonneratiae TaxID=2934936 RepID=UPI0020337EF1|nr:DegQ family serine endoprotease [Allorhizobium sonneratiae]MCM2293007.1 DegQ family serine endoprotease [Allorhizobium sonneratiae]